MPLNIIATSISSGGSQELLRSPRTIEFVKLQGSSTAVGDTSNVYTCRFVTNPTIVLGGSVAGAFSGNTVTFTSLVALGNNTVTVMVADSI